MPIEDYDDERENWSDEPSDLDFGDPEDPDDSDATDPDHFTTVQCTYCGKQIHEDADQCPYCKNWQVAEDAPSNPFWFRFTAFICILLVLGILGYSMHELGIF